MFNIITCLCVVYSIGRAKLDYEEKFNEYMSSLQTLSSSFAFGVLIFVTIFREQVSVLLRYDADQDLVTYMTSLSAAIRDTKILPMSLSVTYGIYKITDRSIPVRLMCDRARFSK